MIAHTVIVAALAVGQALALPALQVRQASEVSSAVASATSAASSVASEATSAASESLSAVSESAASATESASASESAPSASASAEPPSYAAGLLAALRERQAVALADLIEGSPEIAQAVGGVLGDTSQNFTLLAPSDSGLQAATADIDASNTTLVTELLTYHVLPGSYSADSLEINETQIINTAANQNVVLYRDEFGTTQVVGGQDAIVLANATYENVIIRLIDNALSLPVNVSETLSNTEVGTSLVTTLASTAPDLVSQIDTGSVTVFAPSNQAISNAQEALASLAADPQQLQQVILGHVVQGQVLYSNAGPNNILSAPSGISSAAGTEFTFAANETGLFVTSQGTTAQVIRNDLIADNNGEPAVVHIIDAILVPASAAAPSASASESASSAVESASSAVESASESASGAVESATSAAGGAVASATSALAGATASVMSA